MRPPRPYLAVAAGFVLTLAAAVAGTVRWFGAIEHAQDVIDRWEHDSIAEEP